MRKGCRCTGDPQKDPCGYCLRDIEAREDRDLWFEDEVDRGERDYEKWLNKLFGGSE